MRGHDHLRAMRLRGFVPSLVFIHAGEDAPGFWRDWHVDMPTQAHIEVADDEQLSGLDFRCVAGLRVVVTGKDPRRVNAIFEACLACDAKRVLTAERDSAERIEA